MEPLRIACGTVNCYFVRGTGGHLLVDAGAPGSRARIEKAIPYSPPPTPNEPLV